MFEEERLKTLVGAGFIEWSVQYTELPDLRPKKNINNRTWYFKRSIQLVPDPASVFIFPFFKCYGRIRVTGRPCSKPAALGLNIRYLFIFIHGRIRTPVRIRSN